MCKGGHFTGCSARIGRRPLGRDATSATAAPAPAPCFRRRRWSPSQLFSSSDGAQTVAASRVVAIKKEPYTLCKAVFRNGNTSTPGTLCFPSHPRGLSRGLTNSPQDCWFRRCGAVLRVAVPALVGAPWAERRLCDRCPCSGSLFPPQAAVAFTAVLVLRWCTSATSRIIAIKKQPYAMRKTVSGAGEHSKSEPEASLLEASCISLKVIFFVPSL